LTLTEKGRETENVIPILQCNKTLLDSFRLKN